jgi:hypothetical protein
VNPVYGKTRVNLIARRDEKYILSFTLIVIGYCLIYIMNYIYRTSGASKVNSVYGKTRVKSDLT